MNQDVLQSHYYQILNLLGEDPEREGLQDTPKRVAKAMGEFTVGYKMNLDEIVNNALFSSEVSELILVRDIEFYSLCEHHLLPFYGRCHIGYLPNEKVLGLSKFARIVNMYSRRLQIQENLTDDIAKAVMSVTGAKGVGVVIESSHFCMMMRGVKSQSASVTTSVLKGIIKDDIRTRNEFLDLINKH